MIFGRLVRRDLGRLGGLTKLNVARCLRNRRGRAPHLREPVAQQSHQGREVEVHGRRIEAPAANDASASRHLGKQIAIALLRYQNEADNHKGRADGIDAEHRAVRPSPGLSIS